MIDYLNYLLFFFQMIMQKKIRHKKIKLNKSQIHDEKHENRTR